MSVVARETAAQTNNQAPDIIWDIDGDIESVTSAGNIEPWLINNADVGGAIVDWLDLPTDGSIYEYAAKAVISGIEFRVELLMLDSNVWIVSDLRTDSDIADIITDSDECGNIELDENDIKVQPEMSSFFEACAALANVMEKHKVSIEHDYHRRSAVLKGLGGATLDINSKTCHRGLFSLIADAEASGEVAALKASSLIDSALVEQVCDEALQLPPLETHPDDHQLNALNERFDDGFGDGIRYVSNELKKLIQSAPPGVNAK